MSRVRLLNEMTIDEHAIVLFRTVQRRQPVSHNRRPPRKDDDSVTGQVPAALPSLFIYLLIPTLSIPYTDVKNIYIIEYQLLTKLMFRDHLSSSGLVLRESDRV